MSNRIPSFFKTAKNKRFNYEPWYYDAVKEELEERESAIRRELNKELGKDDPGFSRHYHASGIRGSFKSANPRKASNSTLIRLVILAVLLSGVLYILLA